MEIGGSQMQSRSIRAFVAVAALMSAACSAQPREVADCLNETSNAPERNQVKYEQRYSNFEAYRGVALYRLYRSNAGGNGESPLATFDSLDGKKYTPDFNKAACELAAESMQPADPYQRRYWCERVEGLR